MCNRSKTDIAAEVLHVLHEGAARELRVVIGDDSIWHTKTANGSFEELDGQLHCYLSHWLHFQPLGELVNRSLQVLKAPRRHGERGLVCGAPRPKMARKEELFEEPGLVDEASLNETGMLHTWLLVPLHPGGQ